MTFDTSDAGMPFAAHCGIEFEGATAEEVVASLEWRPHLCTAGGILHGSAIATLADSAGALCAYLGLAEGASTATIESSIRYLRAVREGAVRATARPLHSGSRVVTVRTDVVDESGDLVATATQSQIVLRNDHRLGVPRDDV